ncbi:MAG TPA: hypothetical protein VFP11_14920 [Candidatus Angelobacter sp.]|nr:hypothetical protein [Candidatus Angelobacter sp.]
MATGSMNGNRISDNENNEVIRRDLAREQIRQEASALVKRVAEGYSALRSLMEQNPWLTQEMDTEDRERKRAFDEKLQQGLRRANDAPRCRWVKQDGTCCGSPQMRNHIYCYAHRQMMEARALALRLPAAEDANSIQVGLMRIQKALIDDTISTKKAGLLLYSMQLAMTNVGQTTFGKAADDDLVTDTVEEKDAIQEETAVETPGPIFTRDIPGLREYYTSFTAENAEENKTLPLMNADDTDQRKELPRMDADERGLGRDDLERMVTKPILMRDLEVLGQSHAKMG